MMSASMWLSRDEIREMCRASTKKLQVEHLVRNGVPHQIDRHGWPVVSRSVAEATGMIKAKAEADGWRSNKVKAA